MSSHIRAIQTTLKEAGFYTGEIDGIAGKLTVEAVNKAAAKAVVGATEIAIVNDQYETHPENVELTVKEPTSPIKESGFVLGERSLKNLWGVHPDLVAVVKRPFKSHAPILQLLRVCEPKNAKKNSCVKVRLRR